MPLQLPKNESFVSDSGYGLTPNPLSTCGEGALLVLARAV